MYLFCQIYRVAAAIIVDGKIYRNVVFVWLQQRGKPLVLIRCHLDIKLLELSLRRVLEQVCQCFQYREEITTALVLVELSINLTKRGSCAKAYLHDSAR